MEPGAEGARSDALPVVAEEVATVVMAAAAPVVATAAASSAWAASAASAAADQPGHVAQNAPFQFLLHFAHFAEVFGRPTLRLLPTAGADLSTPSPVPVTSSPASTKGHRLFVHIQRMERACVCSFPGPVGSIAPSRKDTAPAPAGGSESAPCVSIPAQENSASRLGLRPGVHKHGEHLSALFGTSASQQCRDARSAATELPKVTPKTGV